MAAAPRRASTRASRPYLRRASANRLPFSRPRNSPGFARARRYRNNSLTKASRSRSEKRPAVGAATMTTTTKACLANAPAVEAAYLARYTASMASTFAFVYVSVALSAVLRIHLLCSSMSRSLMRHLSLCGSLTVLMRHGLARIWMGGGNQCVAIFLQKNSCCFLLVVPAVLEAAKPTVGKATCTLDEELKGDS